MSASIIANFHRFSKFIPVLQGFWKVVLLSKATFQKPCCPRHIIASVGILWYYKGENAKDGYL